MPLQDRIVAFLVTYGFQLLGALVILGVGAVLSKWTGQLVQSWLSRFLIEPPVRLFLVRGVRLIVMALALVLAAAKVGVDIGPMVAGIGVIGVGVGLATQGVLSNLVAGLTILFTKPFRVGEYIEVIGVEGQVTTIDLFTTRLLHTDHSEVVIPNRKIVGEVLHNYGATRQLDLSVGVAYGTDLQKLESVVRNLLEQNPRVLHKPEPVFGIRAFADSSILLSIKPWVAVTDYVPAQAELYKVIVERFNASQIEMPFPRREVRLLKGEGC